MSNLDDELAEVNAELARIAVRRQAWEREQANPPQDTAGAYNRRAAMVLGGSLPDGRTARASVVFNEIQNDFAKANSRRLELERRKRPLPTVEYHHSPAERARLEALAANPDLRESISGAP